MRSPSPLASPSSLALHFLWIGSLAIALAVTAGCQRRTEVITGDLKDAFDRVDVGPDWSATGGEYGIVDGALDARKLRHHPIWLRKRLPHDVAIEFDARPASPDGDIRVILFGDGKSTNPESEGCQSTGYLLVFGGWKNHASVLCRGDETNGAYQRARTDWTVVEGRTYHYYITRKGGLIDWHIDGLQMAVWDDPHPLAGPGHDSFAFDGGQSEVLFDDLLISPIR